MDLLCDEIEAMFELGVSIKSLEDGDIYEISYYIDNSNFMKDTDKYMVYVTILGRDVDSFSIKLLRQTQHSIEGYLLAIKNLQKNAIVEAMGGGLLLVQQLQTMITKVCTDVKRIGVNWKMTLEVVDDGLGNFIVNKKIVSKRYL